MSNPGASASRLNHEAEWVLAWGVRARVAKGGKFFTLLRARYPGDPEEMEACLEG
jgi:hypothetical protein